MYTNVICKNVAYLETCAVCIRINLCWACHCLPGPAPSAQTTPPFFTRSPAVEISTCPQPCPPNRCNCFHLLTCQSSQSICSFSLVTLGQVVCDFLEPPVFGSIQLSWYGLGLPLHCVCPAKCHSSVPDYEIFFSMIPTCSCTRFRFSPSSHLNHWIICWASWSFLGCYLLLRFTSPLSAKPT